MIISKGDNPDAEAYSSFQGTDLAVRLKRLGVDRVFIGGLTADYCVKESTQDARKAGFEVTVLEDCIRAVNVKSGDGDRALDEIRKAGAKLIASSDLVKELASTQQ